MNQQVDVYNREQVLETAKQEGCPSTAVISISNPGAQLEWVSPQWAGLLQLSFFDYTHPVPEKTVFDEDMSQQVKAFVEEHKEHAFLIHCDAGISRSVAIGVWISETLGIPLYTHAIHTTMAANSLVLQLLRRTQWEETPNRKS